MIAAVVARARRQRIHGRFRGTDDTSPEAAALVRRALRRQSPAQRVDAAIALSETMRAISLATLRTRFPERPTLEFVALTTGSVAAAYHGAAQATMDVDAVIDPTSGQLADLVQRLAAAGLYVSEGAAHETLADRTMFL